MALASHLPRLTGVGGRVLQRHRDSPSDAEYKSMSE